ncbi:MAG: hypothetical protein Q8M35_04190, partial [Pseudohongiella sp.]|nr:hypothetical protein [Pseudohongiella sp.]
MAVSRRNRNAFESRNRNERDQGQHDDSFHQNTPRATNNVGEKLIAFTTRIKSKRCLGICTGCSRTAIVTGFRWRENLALGPIARHKANFTQAGETGTEGING